MITFIIIWFILHIGVWVCKIDKFYTGSMDWWEYLFPVLAMSIAIPDMIKEVLKLIKQKK
jgi:heme/copper-type cytochrome/quinol oxidase subunit 1